MYSILNRSLINLNSQNISYYNYQYILYCIHIHHFLLFVYFSPFNSLLLLGLFFYLLIPLYIIIVQFLPFHLFIILILYFIPGLLCQMGLKVCSMILCFHLRLFFKHLFNSNFLSLFLVLCNNIYQIDYLFWSLYYNFYPLHLILMFFILNFEN